MLLHALELFEPKWYNPDTVVLLQATSPFRKAQHIKEVLELYNKECDMVVSVKKSKSNPNYNLFKENTEGFFVKSKIASFTRRQDCPFVFEINGAIYVIKAGTLKKKQYQISQKLESILWVNKVHQILIQYFIGM